MTSIKNCFLLLRPSQWSKAAFVLLGVIYSGSYNYLPQALLAAFTFCLISSAVYIYNDIQDRAEDRLHPHKCNRPLASGAISLDLALSLLFILLVSGLVIAWLISSTLAALLGLYLLLNLAYNHGLKNLPVFDVLCIATGFMLRVLAGTIGIGLPISYWLTLTATLVSLFIALCKRRLEKQLSMNITTRIALKRYSSRQLDAWILITAIGCFLTYLFYIFYARDSAFYFLLTIPFSAIGLWRFAWISTRTADNDDPFSLFLSDNLSRFNLFCFASLTLIALFVS